MNNGEDLEAWEEAIRDVTPLKTENVAIAAPKRKPGTVQKTSTVAFKPIKHELKLNGACDIDKRTMQRLKRAQIPVEGVLDLHHQTEDTAYALVHHFVTEAYLAGKRCIIIVTGKGLHQQDEFTPRGCLKTRVPQWLAHDELRGLILTYVHPPAHMGGEGALMLLLRRKRA